jgi:hypothetical protein
MMHCEMPMAWLSMREWHLKMYEYGWMMNVSLWLNCRGVTLTVLILILGPLRMGPSRKKDSPLSSQQNEEFGENDKYEWSIWGWLCCFIEILFGTCVDGNTRAARQPFNNITKKTWFCFMSVSWTVLCLFLVALIFGTQKSVYVSFACGGSGIV